jgi:hypothetical protein
VTSEKQRGTGSGRDRGQLPLATIFPWWFLVGAVATSVVIAILDSGSWAIGGTLWLVPIVLTVRGRRDVESRLQEGGLVVTPAAVRGSAWIEPSLAASLLLFLVGLRLLLDIPQHDVPGDRGPLGAIIGATGLAGLALVAWLTRRPRRRDRGAG